MDLEVVGRHALFFDDDSTAAFINTSDALVEWNSLLIDRYDVRHLLSGPPPPRRRRNPQQTQSLPTVSSIESELDQERYLDLPPLEEEDSDAGGIPADAGGYNAVAFLYGESTEQKNSDTMMEDSGFRPPFPVPESLLQSLPPTEKVHQIIARTAIFVRKHGGQSEIVLRVKQGDNPTFGFLMPDHHLHAYYRFLVDHLEHLQSDTDGKSESEQKDDTESYQRDGVGAGALSLLGSVYGSGEDEDVGVEDAPVDKENVSQKTSDPGSLTVFHDSGKKEFSVNIDGKDVSLAKHPSPPKGKAHLLKRNSVTGAPKAGKVSSIKKDGDTVTLLSPAVEKSRSSALQNLSKSEPFILEPPSDIKRLVDKIVEFILRNGRQFETVLIEQDSTNGKFPFLLPSNPYYPYYVKVLQNAQESKLSGKSFLSEKDGAAGNRLEKKTSISKENDSLSFGTGCDMPYDYDRKQKFRMVIGKSKKDGQDTASKATQPEFGVSVDAAAAAAILQAATRGIKNPNLEILSGRSLKADGNTHNSEGEQVSSLGSHHSSHVESAIQHVQKDQSMPVPASKAMGKTAAVEAANKADSSEANLSKEQKLKAERLKRAKMFVAMLKSGAATFKPESMCRLSVERQQSGVSGSGSGAVNLAGKEREGSSVPLDIIAIDKEKSDKKNSDDEYHERRSRRKYRSRRHEEEEEEDEEEKDHKHSRKKHQSHRSSREEGDKKDKEERESKHAKKKHHSYRSSHDEEKEDSKEERDHRHSRKKHRSYHSSHEDGEDDDDEKDHKHSRRKHHLYQSSHEEENEEEEEDYKERRHKHSRKKHISHGSSRHNRDRHRHRHKERHSSSNNVESQHQHSHESLSDDQHNHHSHYKHRKVSRSEEELEEGEINSKISDRSRESVGAGVSRETSLGLSKSYQDERAPSQPSEAPDISDDLRAKVRAMLMATL